MNGNGHQLPGRLGVGYAAFARYLQQHKLAHPSMQNTKNNQRKFLRVVWRSGGRFRRREFLADGSIVYRQLQVK